MFKNSRSVIFLAILALTCSTLACGTFSSSQTEEQPSQSAPATEPPVSVPVGNEANSNKTVSCAQLIPPDELNLLLNNASATLSENAAPEGTTCTWQYTPNGGTQENNFYIQTGFTNDALSLWKATRKSELSNEPTDIVVNSINGLGDESYTWVSQSSGQRVVYVRNGGKTLILRFPPDILFLQNESGIIDYADRILDRF
jgi:hypothetical protein